MDRNTEERPIPDASRRGVLKAGAVAAGALAFPFIATPARAQLKKVRLSLPWLPDSAYSYAYIAKNQGFWRKRGLDVEVSRGNGSINVGQAVHAGKFDLGIINASTVIVLASRGVDIIGIGQIDYNSTMGVAVMDDSPIRRPKDLEGKSIGQTLASSDAAFFPVFCERTSVDVSKINRLNMDANVRTRTLWERKVDAITGFASSILPASVAAGHKTRYMLYDDHGIKLYADNVVVKPEFLRDNRAICEAVVDGLMEGVAFELTRPKETLDIYLKELKELQMSATAEQFARLGINIFAFSVLSEPGVRKNGLGWTDPQKTDEMIDLTMKHQAPAGAPRPSRDALFRRDFAGKQSLTEAQWKIAEDQAKSVASLMRPA